MYEHLGLLDFPYLIIYGGVAMLALVACCYLLLARANIFAPTVRPSRELRVWAAVFMAAVAMSHVWWSSLGTVWLQDDHHLRNAIAITLDSVTLEPSMMILLLRMLQDRRRSLWPIALSIVPMLVIGVGVGMIMRNSEYEWMMRDYMLVICVLFIIYMVYAVNKYSQWLRENYADLERKEVWQSLLMLVVILLCLIVYKTNYGGIVIEYATQMFTLVLIFFVIWRVETLQELTPTPAATPVPTPAVAVGSLLEQYREETMFYLQHDLSLNQLAIAIGTNRTYLSSYFATQGITYNTYINRLRVEHFIRLYRKAVAEGRLVTAMEIAHQSGYSSYSTFSIAFKRFTGTTVAEWMKREEKV